MSLHETSYIKDTLLFYPTNETEIISNISNLKNTSSGHDLVSVKLLKSIKSNIAVPLSHITKLSFSTGTIPDSLKLAKIIPIMKNGAPGEFESYRPISVLPALSKDLLNWLYIYYIYFLFYFLF